MVPDMFCNFYLLKNQKIANNSGTTRTTEKISAYLESLEFYECFTKFDNYQDILHKISHRFLETTKLFCG